MNALERIPATREAALSAAYVPAPFVVIPTVENTFALFTARGTTRIFVGFFGAEALAAHLAATYTDTVASYNNTLAREMARKAEAAKPKPKKDLATLNLDLGKLTLDLDLSTLTL